MNNIFSNNFYYQFQAPNHVDIIEFIEKQNKVDNENFSWGKQCKVDRIPISWQDAHELLKPSVNVFSDILGVPFGYTIFDPWVNIYKYGYFQEIHTHIPHDFSMVFFTNTGKNFSDFFFFNKNIIDIPNNWLKLLPDNDISKTVWVPEVNPGDMIFFHSNMLHGVSNHKSKIIRKTLSCNFNFNLT